MDDMTDPRALNRTEPGIVCLAHLGWDYVWQRPQHVLSRLAPYYPVLYINEPTLDASSATGPANTLVAQDGNLAAWQPIFPDRPEVLARWQELYLALVQDLLVAQGWARWRDGHWSATRPLIFWFYTPAPHYILDHITPDLVVYDVMDHLDGFKGGPENLLEREADLLARADVVFAGGRSMYEARRGQHANIHLFSSGVEPDHFARALEPSLAVAPQVAGLRRPVLGYYGVIDERLDLELLAELAAARPEWSIVLVGPVTRIDPAELPHAPNLHYTGRQPYEDLPAFLKGFDVCIMPFALNGATRSISPTKTLEYMAAHKPIVSSSVPDVVANWSDVVRVADGPRAWIRAVEAVMTETSAVRRARARREEQYVLLNTWDAIARGMRRHVEAALRQRTAPLSVPAHANGAYAPEPINLPSTIE